MQLSSHSSAEALADHADLLKLLRCIKTFGVPTESTFAFPAGVLHNDTLFAFGTVTAQQPLEGPDVPVIPAPGVPVLYKYGMWSKLWERLPVPNSPAFSHKSLLAACGKDLLMLGEP